MKTLFRKVITLLTVFSLVFMNGEWVHIHDEECGYDPNTQSGCVYDDIDTHGFDEPHA